jgi:hypothetical protein
VKELGHDLSPEQIVELGIHNIRPEYIREMRELGFVDIPFDQLIELGIHHVTPGFVQDARRVLGEEVSIDKLIEMRIHGLAAKTFRDFQAHGVEIEP